MAVSRTPKTKGTAIHLQAHISRLEKRSATIREKARGETWSLSLRHLAHGLGREPPGRLFGDIALGADPLRLIKEKAASRQRCAAEPASIPIRVKYPPAVVVTGERDLPGRSEQPVEVLRHPFQDRLEMLRPAAYEIEK